MIIEKILKLFIFFYIQVICFYTLLNIFISELKEILKEKRGWNEKWNN